MSKFTLSLILPLVGIALIGALAWHCLSGQKQTDMNDPYRNVPSKISLNPAQISEMPTLASDSEMTIYRYQNLSGTWNVSVGSKRLHLSATAIGKLHTQPVENTVESPLYLCAYSVAGTTSTSLDLKPTCGEGGTPVQKTPIGYSSRDIRTGYLLAIRCRSATHGMYVSLNPRCEAPEDSFSDFLGAIRVADIR